MSAKFDCQIEVVLRVEPSLLDRALTPEWQDSFYTFEDREAVAAHLAYNLVQGRSLSSLDGWADCEDSAATVEILDATAWDCAKQSGG